MSNLQSINISNGNGSIRTLDCNSNTSIFYKKINNSGNTYIKNAEIWIQPFMYINNNIYANLNFRCIRSANSGTSHITLNLYSLMNCNNSDLIDVLSQWSTSYFTLNNLYDTWVGFELKFDKSIIGALDSSPFNFNNNTFSMSSSPSCYIGNSSNWYIMIAPFAKEDIPVQSASDIGVFTKATFIFKDTIWNGLLKTKTPPRLQYHNFDILYYLLFNKYKRKEVITCQH